MVCLLCSETESWVQQYCLSGTALLQGAAGTSTGMRRGGSADRARRGAARGQLAGQGRARSGPGGGQGRASRRPPRTRRRRGGGREDDEASGTAGQEEDATRGRARGARAVGDQRAAGDGGGGGAGGRAREQGHTRPDDVDLKLVRCRREGRGIVGRGGKVSAGWPNQPALMCPR